MLWSIHTSVTSLGDLKQFGQLLKGSVYFCLAQIVEELFKGVFHLLVKTAFVILGDFLPLGDFYKNRLV